jgi:sarcosine oxidase subunit gamma
MADTVIETLPACTRIALQSDAETAARILNGFGIAPPPPLLAAARAGERAALRLAPDEYLLMAEEGAATSLLETPAGQAASLVEISHGRVALRLTGPAAADVLNEACPLDLHISAFPVDACTRTLFGKAEIVLWRIAENGFHVEAARSFAPYLRALLDEALADLA